MYNPIKTRVVCCLFLSVIFIGWMASPLSGRQADRATQVPATVVGNKVTDIYAKVGGYLKSVNVDIGDKVTKDQILAVLDVPELQTELLQKKSLVKQAEAQLVQAQASQNEAKQRLLSMRAKVREATTYVEQKTALTKMAESEFERVERLVNSGAVNQARLDEATFKLQSVKSEKISSEAKVATAEANFHSGEAAVKSAEASVVAAQANIDVANANREYVQKMIEYCTIRAPYSGEVTKRFFDEGAFLQSAEGNSAARPIFQIVYTAKVRVVAQVSMSQMADLEVGTAVTFSRVDALPDVLFKGKVSRRSAGIDEKTRMMRIEVDLDNAEGKLKPGFFGYLAVDSS